MLRRTPFFEHHEASGAKLIDFGGWEMPVQYTSILEEHRRVRESVGLFDVSHMGEVRFRGKQAIDAARHLVTNDIDVPLGHAQYTCMCQEDGGIVDDLIVYRFGEDEYLVVPNAANERAVHQALLENVQSATMVELRDDLILVAPQGPKSFDLVGQLFPDAPSLGYMHCAKAEYRGEPAMVSRSGYTGERGFELWVSPGLAPELWRELLERGEPLGVQPAGLGARDTLRLEMGYPLHGNDIGPDRTPLEAGAGWAVGLDKGGFVGRDALVRQKDGGIPARLWGLRMRDRLIPRPHYAVYAGDEQVGETTSGTFSPTLRAGIAMAYLSPRDRFKAGDTVEVDVRGRRGQAEVVRPPFVDSNPKD